MFLWIQPYNSSLYVFHYKATYFHDLLNSFGYNKVTLSLYPSRLVNSLSLIPSKVPHKPYVLLTSDRDGKSSMSSCQASSIGQDTRVTNTSVPVGRTICQGKESEDQKTRINK